MIEIDWKSGIVILLCLFCSLCSSCNKLSKLGDIETELRRTKDEVHSLRGEVEEIEYAPQNWGVEGVLVSVEQESDGKTVLVFENERVSVHLGSHEVYPGEWNAVILNPRGYVEEVWLGEDWREQYE